MPIIKDPPLGTVIAFAGNFLPDLKTWEEQHGWMLCEGRMLDRTTQNQKYKPLFDEIGSSWGGDGANKFNIPDLEGYFLRGVSGSSGRDPDVLERKASKPGGHEKNDVGSVQEDKMQSHTHTDSGHKHSASTTVSGQIHTTFREWCDSGDSAQVNGNEGDQGKYDPGFTASTTIADGFAKLGDPVGSTGGAPRVGRETRPMNGYVHWIIRWKA